MWVYLNNPSDVAQGERTVPPEGIQSFLEEVTTQHHGTSELSTRGLPTHLSLHFVVQFDTCFFFLKIQNFIDVGIDGCFFHTLHLSWNFI